MREPPVTDPSARPPAVVVTIVPPPDGCGRPLAVSTVVVALLSVELMAGAGAAGVALAAGAVLVTVVPPEFSNVTIFDEPAGCGAGTVVSGVAAGSGVVMPGTLASCPDPDALSNVPEASVVVVAGVLVTAVSGAALFTLSPVAGGVGAKGVGAKGVGAKGVGAKGVGAGIVVA
ncbi:MAG TPA: hypothetical protein VGJ31_02880, partial [Dongiaceae bacterium]